MAKTITVPDTVHGGMTVATCSTDKPDSYVFVRGFTPDLETGQPVYAAYFPVVDGVATIGPIEGFLWQSGEGECHAEHGWFAAQGFGPWKVIASTTFDVSG